MNESLTALLVHAGKNQGVLSREELRALGITRRRQDRLVRDGVLRQATARVFVVVGLGSRWEQQVRIALAEGGPTAALSHASAAVSWEYPRIAPGAVEITVPRSSTPPHRTIGRVHSSRRLGPGDVVDRDGLAVTSPGRTLLDLANRLAPTHLADCLFDLCRRDLVTVEGLMADLERWRGRGIPGAPRLDRLLQACVELPDNDSYLEARFLRLCSTNGLPLPETQVVLTVPGGTYRVDTLWRAWSLVVELNGYGTHASRRRMSQDSERAARLQTAGFEVVVFTYDQVVTQPDYVLAQMTHRLRIAAAS